MITENIQEHKLTTGQLVEVLLANPDELIEARLCGSGNGIGIDVYYVSKLERIIVDFDDESITVYPNEFEKTYKGCDWIVYTDKPLKSLPVDKAANSTQEVKFLDKIEFTVRGTNRLGVVVERGGELMVHYLDDETLNPCKLNELEKVRVVGDVSVRSISDIKEIISRRLRYMSAAKIADWLEHCPGIAVATKLASGALLVEEVQYDSELKYAGAFHNISDSYEIWKRTNGEMFVKDPILGTMTPVDGDMLLDYVDTVKPRPLVRRI